MTADLTPIDELDQSILNLCTGINAATYELLLLIHEFDARGGCLKWGLDCTAKWLAWRCDLSMATAREKETSLPLHSETPRPMWLSIAVSCAWEHRHRSVLQNGRSSIVPYGFVVMSIAA